MGENAVTSNGGEEGRWSAKGAIVLVGLPHLLFALLMMLSELLQASPPAWIGYLLFVAPASALLVAWRQGWPLWSASWAGYAALFAVFSLSSWLGAALGFPLADRVSLFLFFLLIAFGVFLFQRRPLYALLAGLPFFVLMNRFFAFELVAGGDWIFSGIWLAAALLSGAIVRRRALRAAIWLISGFHLLAGAAFTLGRAYLPYRWTEMGPRPASTWQALVNDFAPLTLALITLTLAFLLLHPVWRAAAAEGPRRRRAHFLLLIGIAAALAGMFGLRATGAMPGLDATIGWTALALGLVVSVVSAVALGRTARPHTQQRLRAFVGPLLLAFAPLVVFAPPTPFAPVGAYSASTQTIIILTYAGLLLWTACALWYLLGAQGRIDTLPSARATDATAPAPGPV